MGNKILVEFDRKELDLICAKKCQWYKLCLPKDENYIKCNLRYDIKFKIKEQNDGK